MLLSNQQQAFIREKLLKVTTTTRLVRENFLDKSIQE
ncbi:BnaC02g02580D [Brassica napus]|uniref:BnaC02g02580D protein n=1 Tax=Brassica napus TaxID=3708 RepID=A0A078FM39_BRANA|nr:BnaC02g02580D [Brassica napus]